MWVPFFRKKMAVAKHWRKISLYALCNLWKTLDQYEHSLQNTVK